MRNTKTPTYSADVIVLGHHNRMRAFDIAHERLCDALAVARLDIAHMVCPRGWDRV
jgi:hypothetical protein